MYKWKYKQEPVKIVKHMSELKAALYGGELACHLKKKKNVYAMIYSKA